LGQDGDEIVVVPMTETGPSRPRAARGAARTTLAVTPSWARLTLVVDACGRGI